MKANDLINYLSDVVPYKKKSSVDWIVPISVGLSLGVAFGVGLGILIAPTSGEEARQRLRDSAGKVKERALQAAQRAQEQIKETSAAAERSFANDFGNVR